jgi:hypothetical protein
MAIHGHKTQEFMAEAMERWARTQGNGDFGRGCGGCDFVCDFVLGFTSW